jgi:hypothetical protein
MPKAVFELWKTKIATAAPSARDKLRKEFSRATECSSCTGTGYRLSFSTVQRSPCDECRTTGRDADGSTCRACRGAGAINLGRPDRWRWNAVWCSRCKGHGNVWDEERQDDCPICHGAGFNIPVTVFETGCSKKGRGAPGAEAADDADQSSSAGRVITEGMPVHELDRVADRKAAQTLRWLREVDPDAADALEAFHGAEGDRWAGDPLRGRIFAVWPLTSACRELLGPDYDMARIRGLTALLRPHDRLDAIRTDEARGAIPNIATRLLLADAAEQAPELLERARALLLESAEG